MLAGNINYQKEISRRIPTATKMSIHKKSINRNGRKTYVPNWKSKTLQSEMQNSTNNPTMQSKIYSFD